MLAWFPALCWLYNVNNMADKTAVKKLLSKALIAVDNIDDSATQTQGRREGVTRGNYPGARALGLKGARDDLRTKKL